jgi:hypothetical protein
MNGFGPVISERLMAGWASDGRLKPIVAMKRWTERQGKYHSVLVCRLAVYGRRYAIRNGFETLPNPDCEDSI